MRLCSASVFALAFAISICGGCVPTRRNQFDVVVRNIGGVELDRVRVQFDGFIDNSGVLPVGEGADSRYSDHIGPFPAQAKITWRLPGPVYMPDISEVIAVPTEKPALKNRYQQYELLFELDGKHVKAKYIVNDYTPDN
jgi:hypothetical protein